MAFARQIAAKGYCLLLTDINAERLETLATQLRDEYRVEVQVLVSDLGSMDSLKTLCDQLEQTPNIELLVNCAGFGGMNRFTGGDRNRHLAMMQVHITASIGLTHAVLPGMIARDCGYIINVASIMGYIRTRPIAYGASKRFLIDFSERLQAELSQTQVRIQALCPGMMRTPFFDDPYFRQLNSAATIPKRAWLDVDFVVKTSLDDLRKNRVVCIPARFYRRMCAWANSPWVLWMMGYGKRRGRPESQPVPYGLIDRDQPPQGISSAESLAELKHVVVTGVSTGIGRSAAQQLVRHGFHVFGTIRKLDDAKSLQDELGDRFTPVVCDVCNEASVREAARQVEARLDGQLLWGLVNNAGIALAGPLKHLPLDQVRNQMDVNIVGLIAVTQAFLPLLGARRDRPERLEAGRIVNVSSIAGILPLPMFGAYTASKHAVEALSRSLRTEVAWYGIPVIMIEPGPIESPIWSKMIDLERYQGTDYEAVSRATEFQIRRTNDHGALPVVKASKAIVQALTAKRPKERYIVNQYPLGRTLVTQFLPQAWLDRLLCRRFQKDDAEGSTALARKTPS